MTTITWIIERLDCVPQTQFGNDYVVTAYWRCNGTDGTYNGTDYGACYFTVHDEPGFTPYPNLTQDQVLNWCWSNGVNKTATEGAVNQQIQDQVDPPVISPPLPWNP